MCSIEILNILEKCDLSKIPPNSHSKYNQRLKTEIELIEKSPKSFAKIFLQVYEIVQIIRKLQIPHFIRGSANSSLVCYLMGISMCDPVKENMELARFLNSMRSSLPDIDIDVPHNKRDEIFAEIAKQFQGQVARISNHVRFRKRSAKRKILQNRPTVDWKELTAIPRAILQDKIDALIGTFYYFSLHCGGIVIFDNEIPPQIKLPKPRCIIPQICYDKREIEDHGLIKIDVLSNRAFTQLAEIWSAVCPNKQFNLENYPEFDEKTAKIFANGDILGITLAESPLIRHICKYFKPKSRQHVAMILAIARPASKTIRTNPERLKTCLKTCPKTCEMPIVFDDDAIKFIKNLIHTNDDMADWYRRGFAKQKQEIMDKFRNTMLAQKFDSECIQKTFDKLCSLSAYGFCKGHAVAFAYVVWGLAYHKAHHPKHFWASTLTHSRGMYKKWVLYREALHHGKLELTFQTTGKPYPKWRVVKNKLISIDGKSQLPIWSFWPKSPKNLTIKQFKQRGYWTQNEFLSGMYYDKMMICDTVHVKFKGLIANGKIVTTKKNKIKTHITYLTIGYDNQKYLDLIVKNAKIDYTLVNTIQGYGIEKQNLLKQPQISVSKFMLE